MRFHTPATQDVDATTPTFSVRNGELVRPQAIYPAKQYPTFPQDMVKITSREGRNILIPASKLSSMDY